MTTTLGPKTDDRPDGGHHLVISLGDCEMHAACACGKPFGSIRPNRSLNDFGYPWERHVMTEVPCA